MKTIYDTEINNDVIIFNLERLTNQIFRLLPTNEEGDDWLKPLETLIIELSGLSALLPENEKIFTLLCKLQGLKECGDNIDFMLFRRIVFECCSIAQSAKNELK